MMLIRGSPRVLPAGLLAHHWVFTHTPAQHFASGTEQATVIRQQLDLLEQTEQCPYIGSSIGKKLEAGGKEGKCCLCWRNVQDWKTHTGCTQKEKLSLSSPLLAKYHASIKGFWWNFHEVIPTKSRRSQNNLCRYWAKDWRGSSWASSPAHTLRATSLL